jgi:transposase
MREYTNGSTTLTIGLDLGDRYSYYVALNPEGEIVREGRIPTRSAALQSLFAAGEPSRIAIEVGAHSRWVSRLLGQLGHEVIVANARKVRLIYASGRKDDRLDAERLARLARADIQLLSPIQHRGERAQMDLAVVRSRAQLVEARSRLINHIRMTVKAAGQRLPGSSAEAFARRAQETLQESFPNLIPVLRIIEQLTGEIRGYDRKIETLCEHDYPEAGVLRQIRGVGPVTALTFLLTLEEPLRFRPSRQVGAYLGMCPRRAQSGERELQLPITKSGDRMLRKLLVNCAHYLLGPFGEDCDLRRHGEKLAARGGKNAKKRAVVAVARKLSVLMHHLWETGEVYEPLHNASRRAA